MSGSNFSVIFIFQEGGGGGSLMNLRSISHLMKHVNKNFENRKTMVVQKAGKQDWLTCKNEIHLHLALYMYDQYLTVVLNIGVFHF